MLHSRAVHEAVYHLVQEEGVPGPFLWAGLVSKWEEEFINRTHLDLASQDSAIPPAYTA